MALQERDYQTRIINKVIDFFKDNEPSALIESPTGSGKSIMGLKILEYFEKNHNLTSIWVANRKNLLKQIDEFNQHFFSLKKFTPVSMFDKNPPKADIVVIDEAQHDATSSCIHIHEICSAKYVLGLTATPFRTDRMKLAFKKVVKDAGIQRLINDGWLCPYIHWSIDNWRFETVSQIYLAEMDKWGKSVIFFQTIEECDRFSEILKSHDIRCEVITSFTDRECQLDAFDKGEFNIVANVAILNEGFDCPDLKTVFIRDASKLPTIQMAGRAFRLHYGKEFCNIVQSKDTDWQFTRTVKPLYRYVSKENKWLALGDSLIIDETVKQITRQMVKTKYNMPKYFEDPERTIDPYNLRIKTAR